MAVEDAETPRRQHEQPGAGEQDAGNGNRQLAFLAAEARRNQRDEQRRREHAGEHERRRDEREQRRNRTCDAYCLLSLVSGDERRIHGYERGRQRTFAKQVLQEIGNAERRHERVGGVRLEAEVVGENALADEAGQPAAQDAQRDERRMTVHLESRI